MGFPRQEYCSGLLFPSLGSFLTRGSHPRVLLARQIAAHWATWEAVSVALLSCFPACWFGYSLSLPSSSPGVSSGLLCFWLVPVLVSLLRVALLPFVFFGLHFHFSLVTHVLVSCVFLCFCFLFVWLLAPFVCVSFFVSWWWCIFGGFCCFGGVYVCVCCFGGVCVCVCVFFPRFFSLLGYYKILRLVPCAI